MTATLAVTLTAAPVTSDQGVWRIGAPRLLAGLDRTTMLDLRTHLAVHGPLPATDLAHLLGLLDAARLTGRGGAAFPFAAKLRALTSDSSSCRTVIVNGSESEPTSQKDRTLLRRTPHLVLDGAISVASAIKAGRVVVAVHDATTASAVTQAIAERSDAGRVSVQVIDPVGGTDGFVSGEARALARAVGGGSAVPPGRREHLTTKGTLLSNVETFAQVAILLRLGAARFASTGTYDDPGTMLITISGAVARPGVVELPNGTPLGILLSAAGASENPAAIITGGYHGTWIAPDPALLLARIAIVIVLDRSTCSLGELGRVTAWLAAESAKQCGPCRFGLPALAEDVRSIYRGDARGLEAAARHVQVVNGRGACSHPDGTARFITSGLRLLFDDEVQAHLNGGCGRPVRGVLPVGGTS